MSLINNNTHVKTFGKYNKYIKIYNKKYEIMLLLCV